MATVTNYYTTQFSTSLAGEVERDNGGNQTFSALRSGAGTGAATVSATSPTLFAGSTTNNFRRLSRTIVLFDTSSIPSGATITSAVLRFFIISKSNALGDTTLDVVSSNPASTSSLVAADYGTLGTTSFGNVANLGSVGWNEITLNASGIAGITKSGTTKLGLRLGWDVSGTFSGSWVGLFGTQTILYTTTSPYQMTLTVSYTVDFPTLSVNNISSLSNVTTITTS